VITRHARITARDIIVATGRPRILDGRLDAPIAASRSYAIATRVKKRDGVDGLFWDTADPYHDIRCRPAARSAWLVIGGEEYAE
jgi:glycine/D-amino acid oxidase-like deaminating enzyme